MITRRTLLTGTTAAVALMAIPATRVKPRQVVNYHGSEGLEEVRKWWPADQWELTNLQGITSGSPDLLDHWHYTFTRVT